LATKRRIIALLAALAVIIATGCDSGNSGKTVVHVVPEEFFTGELKRLEPHLEMFAACVKLHATGPPMKVCLTLEEVHNGKPHELGGSESGLDQPNEISLTLRPASDGNAKEKKSHLIVANESEHHSTEWLFGLVPFHKTSMTHSTLKMDVTVPKLSGSSIPMTEALAKPDDLTPDHPVAILGWFEGRGSSQFTIGETIEQKAARVEWAFIVKLELR
jgi:hypothetical protein